MRGLPARGIFFLGAMGLVPGQFGRFRLPPLKQEAFMFLKHTKQTIFLKKVLFLRGKKPLRARGWSLPACILYFFLKRCYFWGKKSPCGHAGGHSQLVFCKISCKNHSKSKIQNVNLKMKNIPRSLRVVGSSASRQVSIVPIRAKFWGFFWSNFIEKRTKKA